MRPVFDYLDYREYLKDAFEERKRADPRLSYRKLAATLGLDASNLHKILRGQVHLPIRCQARALKFLGLENRDADYFLLLAAYARERGEQARREILERARLLKDVQRLALEERELSFYKDWWTSVVRLLLEVREGRADPAQLAKSVCPPITTAEAQASLELLLQLGLVKKAGSGRLKLGEAHLTAGGNAKRRRSTRINGRYSNWPSRRCNAFPGKSAIYRPLPSWSTTRPTRPFSTSCGNAAARCRSRPIPSGSRSA